MPNIELTDAERLEEVGRILALGAIRLWHGKNRMQQKSPLLAGQKTGSVSVTEKIPQGQSACRMVRNGLFSIEREKKHGPDISRASHRIESHVV